jgi:hypothetical protein
MMPSSSQVLDHQLIFHLMYKLRQFHHRQNKGEERGELEKSSSCSSLRQFHHRQNKKEQLLPNIEVREEERRGEESWATGCCINNNWLLHVSGI